MAEPPSEMISDVLLQELKSRSATSTSTSCAVIPAATMSSEGAIRLPEIDETVVGPRGL